MRVSRWIREEGSYSRRRPAWLSDSTRSFHSRAAHLNWRILKTLTAMKEEFMHQILRFPEKNQIFQKIVSERNRFNVSKYNLLSFVHRLFCQIFVSITNCIG